MLTLPLEDAEPGMKLAAPVLHPDHPDQELLRRGYLLEDVVIARMRELHIDFIYVEYPALDHLDRHLAAYLSPARLAIYGQIKRSIASAQADSRPAIPYADYTSSMRDMITTLMEQGQNPIYLDQMSRLGTDAVGHGAAVAHLSLLMGIKLEQYLIDQRKRLPPNRAKDIVNLGIAGMLHDLGVSKLPEELRAFTEVDPPADDAKRREWESHAHLGYEMLRGEVESTAAAAVLQHHQHFDGSGFPAPRTDGGETRIDGQRIHVFARILLCANLYDRLSAPAQGQRRSNVQVLRLLERKYASWLDPAVLTTLARIVPPYPPGCRVSLSDGSVAVVTDINPADPYRPQVRRVLNEKWALAAETIDLSIPNAPTITDPSVARALAG